VAPGFEAVREAFEENLRTRGELGAACCLVRRGERLVDLWGGFREISRAVPWERDTLVLVYSVTKGVTAAALALLHQRGLLDYDAAVARYWPAFGQQGKQTISVRQLLAHQAGLPVIDRPLDPGLLADPDALAQVLAGQRPLWPAGARHAYHALSLGFYAGALLRRIDPTHRSLGRFIREELAEPLGVECYVGLPASLPRERLATIAPLPAWQMLLHPRALSPRFVLALVWPGSLVARTLRNPRLRGPGDLDREPWRSLELPASNAFSNARALATLYGALAGNGAPLGLEGETLRSLAAPPTPPRQGDYDAVFKRRTAFSLGFMRPSADFRFGSSPEAFGAPGVGGSFAFADPASASGYAYVTNKLGFNVFNDARESALRPACQACLAAGSPRP